MKSRIKYKFSLKKYNTFGIEAQCAAFINIKSIDDLIQVLKNNKLPIQIMGGGSNILFTQEHYDRLFIKNDLKGIQIHEVSGEYVEVSIGSGEKWHEFVEYAVKNNWGGIENLSLIPGTMGASPIQNIGAYGVELKDVFVKLEAINLKTLEIETFTNADCQFGYRDSIFKTALKGQYFITKIYLKLLIANHVLHTDYGDIQKVLKEKAIENPTTQSIFTSATN